MKARVMPETAAVIHVGGQRQQREILTIHVVLQIKYFRKTCSGNLRFVPRAIGFLGTEQETQSALDTRSIEIAARANSHQGPRSLRRRSFASALQRGIIVRRTCFAPTAVVVLATLQPIAPAQNPVLRHVLADGAQASQHLPRAINVVNAPAPIPRPVVVWALGR